MITHYAADVSDWQEWAREYRFGVLLIFLPAPLRGQVNALRADHDPAYHAVCDSNIRLTTPLARPVDTADWREFETLAANIEPFAIRYGPPVSYTHLDVYKRQR